MIPFKTKSLAKAFMLAVFAIAALASNAAAQCSGKTVYLQLPATWTLGNAVYVLWEGGFNRVNGTKQGDWLVITLPSVSNDGAAKREIVFSDKDTYNNNAGISYITRQSIGREPNLPNGNADKFLCSDFGANGTYIMENPQQAGKVAISNQPPNAYYFYFLPPDKEQWMISIPYLTYTDASSTPMEVADKCGWYRKTFFNEPVPGANKPLWITLGKYDDDTFAPDIAVGRNGVNDTWEIGYPALIDLKSEFDRLLGEGKPGSIYYEASANEGNGRWSGIDPGTSGTCTYDMAAIMYDTDQSIYGNGDNKNSLNGPFKCGIYETCADGPGISRGIVNATLNGERKMTYRGSGASGYGNGGGNDGWSAATLEEAFKATTGKNVQRCYDMPFARNKQGLWEFDSDRLCNNGQMDPDGICNGTYGGYMGGFFPPELQTRGTANYSQCTSCDTKRKAEGWVPLKANINKWCFDRGWLGTGNEKGDLSNKNAAQINAEMRRVCSREFTNGDFRNGDNPPDLWDWGATRASVPDKNLFFCFESHSEFTYAKGQEFFFRGDDDIWIYINDKLVIDLGGSHLAAPGYVNLDTIQGLVEGGKYPIDIFFCDARSTMSNVRITTNMYFSQSSGWQLQSDPTKGLAQICLTTTTTGNTCGAGGGGTSQACGGALAPDLTFYMNKGSGNSITQVSLNPSNPNCSGSATSMTCYDGNIVIQNGNVELKGGSNTSGYPGLQNDNYTVYVKHNTAQGLDPLKIGTIKKVPGSVSVVYGRIVDDDENVIAGLPELKQTQTVIAGKLVPVGFAAVTTKNSGGFSIDPEANEIYKLEGSFTDAAVAGSSLKVYKDAAGDSLLSPGAMISIPSNGVLVLWVKGVYEAAGEANYSVKGGAIGGVTEQANIYVYLPVIKFTNEAGTAVLPPNTWQTRGSDATKGNVPAIEKKVYIGEWQTRWVAAYDGNDLCTTCEFDIFANSFGIGSGNADFDETVQFSTNKLIGGKASLTFAGMKETKRDDENIFLKFSVRGPSKAENTVAWWDSLHFEKPKVPVPLYAEIHDRDGDGFGDEIRIAYDSDNGTWEFKNAAGACIGDAILPNYIEIFWDLDIAETIGIGPGKDTIIEGKKGYKDASDGERCAFWNDKISKVGDNWLITLKWEDFSGYPYEGFSQKIKTAVGKDKDKVTIKSWESFRKTPTSNVTILGLGPMDGNGLQDKIPAIVVSARYEAKSGEGCGTSAGNKCDDRIILELSEPVVATEGAQVEATKTAFAYWLGSRGKNAEEPFEVYAAKAIDVAEFVWWGSSGRDALPSSEGVSTVEFAFKSYRDAADTTNTPEANDSVKFAHLTGTPGFVGEYAIRDLAGNTANIAEKGRVIEGRNRTQTGKIPIAEQDPTKDILGDALKEIAGKGVDYPEDIFEKNNTEWLVVLPDWKGNIVDSLKNNYPGSAGYIVMPDIKSQVRDLNTKYKLTGEDTIPNSAITFHAKVFYHTNLGNFTADRSLPVITCEDDIFKVNGAGDCRDKGVYIAWNLKDNSKPVPRWVGAGAYVAVYDFYWEVNYDKIHEKLDQKEKRIEMFGVKRIKSSKK